MVDKTNADAKSAEKYRGGRTDVAGGVDRLVEKGPRFGRLAKAIESGQAEVSDAQREFLDDFREKAERGVGCGEGTS